MLSNIDLENLARVAWLLVTAAVLFYASYWALIIRRALAVQSYRNQALGVALIALFQGVTTIGFAGTEGASGRTPLDLLALGANTILFLFVFYWIDASVLAAKRSDPLLRDTLHWRSLRLVLWPLIISFAAAAVVSNFSLPFNIILTLVAGAASLPVAARRSRDPTMRRHLIWFGLYAAFLLAFFFNLGGLLNVSIGSPASFVFLGIGSLMYFAASYCLYRSAVSLAPLRQLPESVYAQNNR